MEHCWPALRLSRFFEFSMIRPFVSYFLHLIQCREDHFNIKQSLFTLILFSFKILQDGLQNIATRVHWIKTITVSGYTRTQTLKHTLLLAQFVKSVCPPSVTLAEKSFLLYSNGQISSAKRVNLYSRKLRTYLKRKQRIRGRGTIYERETGFQIFENIRWQLVLSSH